MANKSIYDGFERMWQHIVAYVDSAVSDSNGTDMQTMVDMVYPVGSVYISLNETNPFADYGTWEKIDSETFLMSAGIEEFFLGETGGSNTTTLTLANLPHHTHTAYIPISGITAAEFGVADGNTFSLSESTTGGINDGTTEGETPKSFSNMPKYLAVNMWKRVN